MLQQTKLNPGWSLTADARCFTAVQLAVAPGDFRKSFG
jgi:hypothetical protein